MNKFPEIKTGDWIVVDGQNCVVKNVYPQNSMSGVCLVVFNKKKPTTHDVDWDGEKWFFPDRPDYGGYARDSDPYVQQLKRGSA
jgi:hypothetical protein